MKMNKKKITSLFLASLMGVAAVGVTGCKKETPDNENTIEISIFNGGWGIDWIKEAEPKFEALHPEYDVIIKEELLLGKTEAAVKAGPNITTTDIFFPTDNINSLILGGSSIYAGYDVIFEPLDEVYDYKPDGTTSVRDKMTKYALDAVTYENVKEGKTHEYTLPLTTNSTGIIYNKTKFDALEIVVPRTTDELYDVTCAKINDVFATEDRMKSAFTDSIKTAYSQYMLDVWWAQYETVDGVVDYWNGRYRENGLEKYGPEVFKQKGRLYAAEAYEKMINPEAKNNHTNINSMNYMQAQQQLFNGNCLMMVNGSWLENEMKIRSSVTTTDELVFMKTPIISAIREKTPSIASDEVLREVISYVDGDVESKPAGVTDADVELIRAARNVKYGGSVTGGFIPAYSNAKEAAKEFLKYLCSEEFAQIYFDKTGGDMISFNKSATDISNASSFIKSVYQNLGVEMDVTPDPYKYPMACLGGMLRFPGTVGIPAWFSAKNSADRMTAQQIYDKGITIGDQGHYDGILSTAGLI